MRLNYLLDSDSYKASHWLQFPSGMEYSLYYIESRGGQYPETKFFNLQAFIKRDLCYRVTEKDVHQAQEFYKAHGEPFNYNGWMYIVNKLGGKLPLRIRAVPEGAVVPVNNVLATIESTDPNCFWVPSWIETSLLRAIWYGTAVATRSYVIKKIILEALEKSSDDPNSEINFKLHDFGSRGVSSQESAMVGGAAHLINFMGSDTVAGVWYANEYYNCPMSGFSIPAAEHSTITVYGKENEVEAYRNMLKQFARPGSLVAVVSDSYDLWNAVENIWGGQLRQEVIDSGATVVIRPDSGHPPSVVLKTAQILDSKFGSKVNSKGYKVLNNVRIIQGDGITEDTIKEILDKLLEAGFSATNIAFGCGGYLLQSMNRDTNRWAMKLSYAKVNGQYIEVFKDPITDPGKRSKCGYLDLIRNEKGGYETIKTNGISDSRSVMRTVFENGDLLINETLDEIRQRV